MMLRASFGVDPWTVFAEGFHVTWGFGIGWVIVVSGLVVLLIWIPLRQRPGVGTVLNALHVGPFMEVGLAVIETPETVIQRVFLSFGVGTVIFALAIGPIAQRAIRVFRVPDYSAKETGT